MKKVLGLLTAFVFVGLVACGPSAEEKAAKAAADSTRVADSMATVNAAMAAEAAAVDTAAAAPADTTKK